MIFWIAIQNRIALNMTFREERKMPDMNENSETQQEWLGIANEKERKEMLKKKGYLTVNSLIKKLRKLSEEGHGEDLVGSDYELYKYCEYDNIAGYVIVE